MRSRLDALIEQLYSQKADALLIEAGNSLFLVRGSETLPLVNARLTNEHVGQLLRDAAPPDARMSIERRVGVEFDYMRGAGPVHIQFASTDDKSFARVTPGAMNVPGLAPPSAVLDDSTATHELAEAAPQRAAIDDWFDIFLATKASDLHLTPGMPAKVRSYDGDIQELGEI